MEQKLSLSESDLPTAATMNPDRNQVTVRSKRKNPECCDLIDSLTAFRAEMAASMKEYFGVQNEIFLTFKRELGVEITELKNNINNAVKSELVPITSSISELKAEFQTTLSDIHVKQTELKSELNSVQKMANRNAGNIETLEAKVTENAKNSVSQSELIELRSQVDDLRAELRQQQQYDRLLNLEINGLPETKNEDLYEIFLKIAAHVGVSLEKGDILHAHRVQSREKTDRPKSIIVKMRTRLIKGNIIAGLRKTKGVTTLDISMPGDKLSIFVNDHLTVSNKILHKQCRERAEKMKYQYVWTKNCKIFARKHEQAPLILIKDEADLGKMI